MMRKTKKTMLWTIPPLILLLLLLGLGTALAADGNLPGGTSISVDITAPSDGAVKVFPPGSIDLEGTASVAEGVIVKDTTVVFVMDISDSMNADAGVDCDGIAGNDEENVILISLTYGFDFFIAAAVALGMFISVVNYRNAITLSP